MSKTEQPDETATFLKIQLEELLEMSDEDVLDGDDPGILRSENLTMISLAKAEAGRRRMAAAKAAVVNKVTPVAHDAQDIDIDIDNARKFLELAMNDPRYTMAARSLSDMTENDIIRLYRQLKQLSKDET